MTSSYLGYEFGGNIYASYIYALLDTLRMMKGSPLSFPVPLLMEDCICLDLRSNILAELRAKVAFQCHNRLLDGFAGALLGYNSLHAEQPLGTEGWAATF